MCQGDANIFVVKVSSQYYYHNQCYYEMSAASKSDPPGLIGLRLIEKTEYPNEVPN